MSRRGGTWARVDESVHTHPKSLALADELQKLGVPQEYAGDVVVSQLHRLICWCLRNSETGRVGHLPCHTFALILGWQNPALASELHSAWMSSGFIDWGGQDRARLHDFEAYASPILRHRGRKKREETASDARVKLAPTENRKPKTESRNGKPPIPPLGVRTVFDTWKEVMGHRQARLTAKRERLIRARFREGYTVDDLLEAIRGCKASAWHMGANDNGQVYDDIELICRDGGKVEAFQRRLKTPANGRGAKVSAAKIRDAALERMRDGNT